MSLDNQIPGSKDLIEMPSYEELYASLTGLVDDVTIHPYFDLIAKKLSSIGKVTPLGVAVAIVQSMQGFMSTTGLEGTPKNIMFGILVRSMPLVIKTIITDETKATVPLEIVNSAIDHLYSA